MCPTEEMNDDSLWRKVRFLLKNKSFSEALNLCNILFNSESRIEEHYILEVRSYIYWSMGYHGEAITDISKAIKNAPRWRAHRYRRALWYLEMNRFLEAIDDCDALIDLDREFNSTSFSESAKFFRAFALVNLKRFPEALSELELVEDEKSFWISRRLWNREQLMQIAKSQ